MQAFQAGAMASGAGSSSSSINQSVNSKARGFDERAAKAAAEVRKKAAARGIPVRSNPNNTQVQPQALRPPSQLFNIMNPTTVSPTPTDNKEKTDDLKKKAKEENSTAMEGGQGQPPVGLGRGLGSLDSKKQKAKLKVSDQKTS